jgi:hypothetical protein
VAFNQSCGLQDLDLGGEGGDPDIVPDCAETARGTFLCSSVEGPWIIRTGQEYDAFLASCPLPPSQQPPRPGSGQVLVALMQQGSGCTGCLDIICCATLESEVRVESQGTFEGDCDQVLTLGAWALMPELGVEINFQHKALAACP